MVDQKYYICYNSVLPKKYKQLVNGNNPINSNYRTDLSILKRLTRNSTTTIIVLSTIN